MDYQKIIDKYYPEDNELKRLLIRHSHDVAHRALLIADRNPQIALDKAFVEEAAMLHDIGIFTTDAPGIHCHGKDPYIRHGINAAGRRPATPCKGMRTAHRHRNYPQGHRRESAATPAARLHARDTRGDTCVLC